MHPYTEADAAFDNEQQGGCPIHGLNHPECRCCRVCGWRNGGHAADCEAWVPHAVMLSDEHAWRQVSLRAKRLALQDARERYGESTRTEVVQVDDRTYRHLGFVEIYVSRADRWSLYEYRQRDDRLFLSRG